MKGLDIPSRPLTFQRNQAAGSRPSGTIIRSGAGFSTTTVSTTRADGSTSLCAGFFTVARLGLALATVRFVAFALADLDALRALPRLADLRSFARFCTFDRFLGLAMIAIPLVGVRYRLPRGHGRSNDKRKSEQLIQRVFKSPLESTVRGQHGQHALLSLVPSSLVAPLTPTRLAQRWRKKNIRIQSGIALSTAVRGVHFTLAGPREDRSSIIGPTPIDAACRGTYGDNAKPSG